MGQAMRLLGYHAENNLHPPLVLEDDHEAVIQTHVDEALIIVSGSIDNTIRVWDANNGTHLRKLIGHKVPVLSMLQIGPGTIATGGQSGSICLWDINTGDCISVLEGHTRSVRCMVKLDSMTVASGSDDGDIRQWDIRTGLCVRTMEGHEGPVESIIHCRTDVERLISGGTDWSIRIWHQNGECDTLRKHTDPVHCLVSFYDIEDEDVRFASGSGDETIRIWNIVGQSIMTLMGHVGAVRSLVYLGGNTLASGSEDETIRIWDLSLGDTIYVLEEHTGHVLSLSFYNPSFLISGSEDSTIKIWCSQTGECLSTLHGHHESVTSLLCWQYLIPQHSIHEQLGKYVNNMTFADLSIIINT